MHDIKKIREYPKEFDTALSTRGIKNQSIKILELDLVKRETIQEMELLQSDLNKLSGQFNTRGTHKKNFNGTELQKTVKEKKNEVQKLGKLLQNTEMELRELLLGLPNIPEEKVPPGDNESHNIEVNNWGEIEDLGFVPKEHFNLASACGLDLKSSAKISGSRFSVLKGGLATLHRALSQFMLDTHLAEHDLQEVATPVLVKNEAMEGTGQLPKFEAESYQTKNGWWLIPTAEVSLTNLKAQTITALDNLPERVCAATQCFRSEAGSAGKDTAGILRQHQFEKVEMVTFCTPETSSKEHERMSNCAENILKKLQLPFRKMVLCTGDMGFSAKKTYDLEVWLPGQGRYREISSISNCGDFQARRMNARFKRSDENKPEFLHTLNGSGLAVGRCLIAILENYQTKEGMVKIPACLEYYLKGAKYLNLDGELE